MEQPSYPYLLEFNGVPVLPGVPVTVTPSSWMSHGNATNDLEKAPAQTDDAW